MKKNIDVKRLETARNIWLATVRASGAPHLVPIWFVWQDGKAFICTGESSVKARNILKNPSVALALEDGDDPLVLEGKARTLKSVPPEVVRAFRKKFDWDIREDATYNTVIEIVPARRVL